MLENLKVKWLILLFVLSLGAGNIDVEIKKSHPVVHSCLINSKEVNE